MVYRLTTLAKLKAALRVDSTDEDEILDMYLTAASQAVIKYIGDQAGTLGLTDSPAEDAPDDIATATIMLAGHFYRDPDGDEQKAFEANHFPRPVRALLAPYRDPTFA